LGDERLWGVTSEGMGMGPQWGLGAEPLVRESGGKARQQSRSGGCAPRRIQGQSPWSGGLGAKFSRR